MPKVRNVTARHTLAAVVTVVSAVAAGAALAADQVHDEIQVYNADIAEVGQWTYQQHLNYAAVGQTVPEFPGGFTSNHSLQARRNLPTD